MDDFVAGDTNDSFREWLKDRRFRRQMPHRLGSAEYVAVGNDTDKHDGQWKVNGKRQTIYAKCKLSIRDRTIAAKGLVEARKNLASASSTPRRMTSG